MCLNNIKYKFKNNKITGIGWKIILSNKDKDKDNELIYGYIRKTKYTKNKWMNSTKGHIVISNFIFSEIYATKSYYEKGFHIYKTKKDALKKLKESHSITKYPYKGLKWLYLKLAKVQYRNITTVGTEDSKTVIVAKEMKILEIK